MLAKVAVRSLCGAISGDAKLTRRVQANGKFTPEYRRLRAMDVPPEVRAWIRDQCWEPGPVLDAVRSQLAIALERHRCEAPHYRIPSVEVRPGPGTTHHDPLLQLPCEPWH